jgi:hypothetical protein
VLRPVTAPGVDLSTRAKVAKYLDSLGISSKGIVIQRGKHNYAGTHCPGRTWTCTTSKRVVQISFAQNVVQFTCTPSTGGTVVSPNTCVIVQLSSSGAANSATCTEKVQDPTDAQSCSIFQVNTTGTNTATVGQQTMVLAGPVQTATQSTDIAQWNRSGANLAYVSQDIKENQSAANPAGGSLTQQQDGHETTAISQHSDTGNNTAQVNQTLGLNASAMGGASISQLQDTDPTAYNTSAAIYQNADSFPASGTNSATLNQRNDLNASGSKTGTLTQTQGAFTNGLLAHIEQHSTPGLSTQSTTQTEHQNLSAGNVPAGQLHQTQIGPIHYEPNQDSNPADTMSVSQNSNQNATPSGVAFQVDRADGSCETSGNCTITEDIRNAAGHGTNSCSSSSCNIGLTVTPSEGGSVIPCSGECTDLPFPPPPPPNICDVTFAAPPCVD